MSKYYEYVSLYVLTSSENDSNIYEPSSLHKLYMWSEAGVGFVHTDKKSGTSNIFTNAKTYVSLALLTFLSANLFCSHFMNEPPSGWLTVEGDVLGKSETMLLRLEKVDVRSHE